MALHQALKRALHGEEKAAGAALKARQQGVKEHPAVNPAKRPAAKKGRQSSEAKLIPKPCKTTKVPQKPAMAGLSADLVGFSCPAKHACILEMPRLTRF